MSNENPGFKVTDHRRRDTPEPSAPAAAPAPARIDFTTFLFSLAQTALIQLGVSPDPDGQALPPQPALAHETIDILGLLKEKTKGNLTDEEQRILDGVLYDLRLKYVEVVGKKK